MNYNHLSIEKEMLNFWKKKKIFDKLRKKNKGKKNWSFMDGPITANNPMGVHHAWGRTYKDLYQRFKAMQGYDQRFQNGFDCQGLWLEVETERELGFNSKMDIEKYGLARFSRACRARVNKFSKIQTGQSLRLGQWMDWDNSYYTMDDYNIESIWYFLKKCYEKGWLYKGSKVLPWCIRCGTSSSQHEMADEGYKELIHPSVYIKCKIRERENEYLLIWTTTEWTLSSNVAVAVNPELEYSQVKKGKDIYYLSEMNLNKFGGDYIVLNNLKGKELLGLVYESPYSHFDVQKDIIHRVIAWNEVSGTDGTGIVHIAPNCGDEDYELGKKEKLPLLPSALDEVGNYVGGFGWMSGKNVKEVQPLVIKDLEKRGFLYKVESYKHRYPVCWRCGQELVFRLGEEWFISSQRIRPLMKKAAHTVLWVPSHVGKLMQNWLDTMGDWNISRKRYWGLPLMFFECPCGNVEVIGSRKELRGKAIDKKIVDTLPELHRPWIDRVKIKCSRCGMEISRIKEVGDCWLDAGIVPFSTLGYFDDRRYWRKWFPAELVIEMRAQIRLWFYSQLFMSVTLENAAPYKKVFAYEVVKDEKGEDMHKSKGNALWFDDVVNSMGADIMRWIYTSQNPSNYLPFGYTFAKEVERYVTVIWNLSYFVLQYCCLSKIKDSNLDIATKWILSRRESTKKRVTHFLENLQPHLAMKEIKTFLLDDLSRGYIHLIRDVLDEKRIQAILLKSYLDGIILLAPFLPFITEKIYQNLASTFRFKQESIHLYDWPHFNDKFIDERLEEQFIVMRRVIQETLAQREKFGYGVRWPFPKLGITLEDPSLLDGLEELMKRQVNVKEIIIKRGNFSLSLDTTLTMELEREGYLREVLRRIQVLRKKNGLHIRDRIGLNISSDYDLSIFAEIIAEKVGAKKLSFNAQTYIFRSQEKIKDHIFEISFQKL